MGDDCLTGDAEAVAALRAAVASASTGDLNATLNAIVDTIDAHIPALLRASIRIVADDDPTQVEITALWSAVPTDLTVGLRMPVRSTSLPDVTLSGTPDVRDLIAADAGILDAIVRDEGIRSFVSLPLHRRTRVVGLLSFSSGEAGAFSLADLPLLVEAADLVSSRLAQPT